MADSATVADNLESLRQRMEERSLQLATLTSCPER